MFSGSIVALITPFKLNGDVDFDSLKKLVDFHVDSGTDAIVSVATTGESATLSVQEHMDVIKETIKFSDGRIPIIAGMAGANCTKSAADFITKMNDSGAVGFLSVTPYYNKPPQEGLYQHYKIVAEASKLPIILYNVPSRTGVDLLPETVGRLAKIENIIGLKDATGDLSRVAQHIELCGKEFILLSGDDATGYEFIRQGGQGVISVVNNLAAKDMALMIELASKGQFEQAEKINQQLSPLYAALFIESSPIPVKYAAQKMGLIPLGGLRLPLVELSDLAIPKVMVAMNKAKLC